MDKNVSSQNSQTNLEYVDNLKERYIASFASPEISPEMVENSVVRKDFKQIATKDKTQE